MGAHSRGKVSRKDALAAAAAAEAEQTEKLKYQAEQEKEREEREAKEAKLAAMHDRLKMSGVKIVEKKETRLAKVQAKLRVVQGHGRSLAKLLRDPKRLRRVAAETTEKAKQWVHDTEEALLERVRMRMQHEAEQGDLVGQEADAAAERRQRQEEKDMKSDSFMDAFVNHTPRGLRHIRREQQRAAELIDHIALGDPLGAYAHIAEDWAHQTGSSDVSAFNEWLSEHREKMGIRDGNTLAAVRARRGVLPPLPLNSLSAQAQSGRTGLPIGSPSGMNVDAGAEADGAEADWLAEAASALGEQKPEPPVSSSAGLLRGTRRGSALDLHAEGRCTFNGTNPEDGEAYHCVNLVVPGKKMCGYHARSCLGDHPSGMFVRIQVPNIQGLCNGCYVIRPPHKAPVPMGDGTPYGVPGARKVQTKRIALVASLDKFEDRKDALTADSSCAWRWTDPDTAMRYVCRNKIIRDSEGRLHEHCGWHARKCLMPHPAMGASGMDIATPNEHGLCLQHYTARHNTLPKEGLGALDIPGVERVTKKQKVQQKKQRHPLAPKTRNPRQLWEHIRAKRRRRHRRKMRDLGYSGYSTESDSDMSELSSDDSDASDYTDPGDVYDDTAASSRTGGAIADDGKEASSRWSSGADGGAEGESGANHDGGNSRRGSRHGINVGSRRGSRASSGHGSDSHGSESEGSSDEDDIDEDQLLEAMGMKKGPGLCTRAIRRCRSFSPGAALRRKRRQARALFASRRAAITLQRWWRGTAMRRDPRFNMKQQEWLALCRNRVRAADLLQRAYHRRRGRMRFKAHCVALLTWVVFIQKQRRGQICREMLLKHRVVVKIQCIWRLFLARMVRQAKATVAHHAQLEEDVVWAVQTIQRYWRGSLGRFKVWHMEQEQLELQHKEAMCTSIQKYVRGAKGRAFVRWLLEAMQHEWEQAIQIQRVFRGYTGRLAYAAYWQTVDTHSRILQRVARGFVARRRAKQRKSALDGWWEWGAPTLPRDCFRQLVPKARYGLGQNNSFGYADAARVQMRGKNGFSVENLMAMKRPNEGLPASALMEVKAVPQRAQQRRRRPMQRQPDATRAMARSRAAARARLAARAKMFSEKVRPQVFPCAHPVSREAARTQGVAPTMNEWALLPKEPMDPVAAKAQGKLKGAGNKFAEVALARVGQHRETRGGKSSREQDASSRRLRALARSSGVQHSRAIEQRSSEAIDPCDGSCGQPGSDRPQPCADKSWFEALEDGVISMQGTARGPAAVRAQDELLSFIAVHPASHPSCRRARQALVRLDRVISDVQREELQQARPSSSKPRPVEWV